MTNKELKIGIFFATFAYILWGFLPIYWKAVGDISAGVILSHRIIWSFIFMILLLLITRKWHSFIRECYTIIHNKKKLSGLILASFVISGNWLIFIWAVNSDHVIQASLGYYINPLLSILLGIVVLKETLNKWEVFSVALAGIGVLYLTVHYGVFPWISLLLALSFAIYGLVKKVVDIPSLYGLTLETFIVFPLALLYLAMHPADSGSLINMWYSPLTAGLLMGAGVVTAVPLLLFASGAKRIPLSMIGFLQYIAPTLMLIIGVFVYKEAFTSAHLIAFVCIWTALAIYTLSKIRSFRNNRRKATL
ncbi:MULTISPECIES: EamA family transporter RarD [Paraliobacillus]|uniref:EamA family transporter RarD n=1 Tax=Paraliobacillus TaxID=200903 RepID=UPI000DD31884|nr:MULTISPECIES: EamA family transporter RarD [Paraliobacillus]